MSDPVYEAFLDVVAADAADCCNGSDILTLTPRVCTDRPPCVYDAELRDVEHLARVVDGTVRVSSDVVVFTVQFPTDYCRSTDASLQFRVVSVSVPLFHPNVRGSLVCLGPRFRPGTRLRPLLEQIYRIVSGRVRATEHAFEAEACWYYLRNLDQVRALRARPLWRRPVIGRASVTHGQPQDAETLNSPNATERCP